MRPFRLGQRVMIADAPPHQRHLIGETGTITGVPIEDPRWQGVVFQRVRWDKYGYVKEGLEPIAFLAPIDDSKAFERFMERVLKPVDLPQEIVA